VPKFLEVTDKAAARAALGGINSLVINFADYGACDGVTNDASALTAALAELDDAGGGTLQLPPKSIALTLTAAGPMFTIPANTRIVGSAGATKLLLSTSGTATNYRCFAATSGNNVTFDGVTFVRQSDYTLVFLFPGPYDGFHLRNCVIDGRYDSFPTNYVHGVLLDSSGAKSNITFKGSTIKGTWYGVLQNNDIASPCNTIVVDDCTFSGNFADDLCFNAPNSTNGPNAPIIMKNVSVTNSRFMNNVSTASNRGFGVCFAHVAGGTVHGCFFENFPFQAVHIEDYSTNISVIGNHMVNCGTSAIAFSGPLIVLSGSSDITISGNTIDARNNNYLNAAISVLAGGSGTTPSGSPEIPPTRVTVSDNVLLCGDMLRGLLVEHVSKAVVQGNQIFGAGAVTAGVWDAGNENAGLIVDGSNITISANTISGFRHGMTGPFSTDVTLGDPGAVSGNVVSDCYTGIHAASPGAVTISGNTLSNCVRPMVVGEAGATSKPCTVTGNFASGCVYPLEVSGRLTIIRDGTGGTQTVGASKSIFVIDKLLKIPTGAVFTFSGGGVFTVTTAAVAQLKGAFSYELVGTVTNASIGPSEVGTATTLAHSTTGGNNYVQVSGNSDTVAEVYTIQSAAIATTLAGKTLTAANLSSATNTFPTFDSDQLSAGLQTLPRWMLNGGSAATASDFVYLTYCTAHKDLSVTTINMICGATAAANDPSLVRIGIYSENPSTGALTLVGSTANDAPTTMFDTAFGPVTKELSATTALTAGTRYAFGLLVVSAAACPTPYGVAIPSALATLTPRRAAVASAVAGDLPASIASGALFASGALMYVAAT
jgi:hypothetical protein